jgi:hypothetical protein
MKQAHRESLHDIPRSWRASDETYERLEPVLAAAFTLVGAGLISAGLLGAHF